jgi:hypothetical protein
MNAAMKWILGIALVAASATIIVPVLLRYSETARDNGRLTSIHESGTC